MVIEWIVNVLDFVLSPIIGVLPTSPLSLPSLGGFMGWLGDLDSLIPILGPLGVGGVLLAGLAAFLVIRAVLMIWHALPLT